jgi:hypothetical protein
MARLLFGLVLMATLRAADPGEIRKAAGEVARQLEVQQ